MDPFLAVLIALCAAAAAAGAGFFAVRHARQRGLPRGETVIVCTSRPDDQSIHGIVADETPRWIVLQAARYLEPTGDSTPIGDAVIPQAAVAFVQVGVAPLEAVKAPPARRPSPPLPDTARPSRLTAVADGPGDAAARPDATTRV